MIIAAVHVERMGKVRNSSTYLVEYTNRLFGRHTQK